MKELALQELTWKDVRASVKKLNPTLFKAIEAISPDDSYTFFKATYPYGSEILQKGKLFLPTINNELIPMKDPRVSTYIQKNIGYSQGSNPPMIVLKNTLNLLINLDDRIVDYSVSHPGNILGLWRTLDHAEHTGFSYVPVFLWSMTAGARSISILPKISDSIGFNKIQKKYAIQSEKPRLLKDHWNVIKDIVKHPAFENTWETELLFFSEKWFQSLNDPTWHRFKMLCFESAWKSSAFWRNQYTWDLTFSRIQSDRGLKPCPYIADVVSHLLAISAGALPGFAPATDDTMGPIRKLQKIFEEEYDIDYAPIFIVPTLFSIFNPTQRPIYYSLNYHTAVRLSPKSNNRSSVMNDLYAMHSLLIKYTQSIIQGDLNVTGTPLYEASKIVDFSFFHHDNNEGLSNIYPSAQLIQEDPAFLEACKGLKNKTMPKNPPFLNGCVRIAIKEKN